MSDEDRLLTALEDTAGTGARLLGVRIASYSIGFVGSLVIARALGPTGRGLYALPVAFLGIVMALTHVGLESSNVYLAARGAPLRRLWATSTLAAVLASLVAWGLISVVRAASGPEFLGGLPVTWIAIVAVQLPLLLMSLYWTNLLQLQDGVVVAARALLAGTVAHVTVVLVVVSIDALTPFRVLALTWVLAGVTWGVLLRSGVRRGLAGLATDSGLVRRAIVFGLRAQLATALAFLLLRVDQLLVQHILGFHALGLYAFAVVLAELLWLVTDPFAASLLPHQVRATDEDERRLGYATARLSLVIALILCLLAWVLAPYAIRLAYGEAFVEATWAFRWLLPGVVAIAAQRPLYAIVTKQGRLGLAAALNAGALTLNVGLNLLLLKRLGIVGASVASTVTYLALGLGYVHATRRTGVVGWRDLVPRRTDLLRLFPSTRRRGAVADRPTASPRVLFVIGTLERGGAEGQLVLLARRLAENGWRVGVLCLSAAGALAELLEAGGVEVTVFTFGDGRPILHPIRTLRWFSAVRDTVRERAPDVVHTYLYWGNLVGVWAARGAGVPVTIASQRSLRETSGAKLHLRPWERWTMRNADAWVCNSNAVLTDAVRSGVEPSKAIVIVNGVHLPEAVSPPPADGPVVCIANLIAYKGHDALLGAFANAVRTAPSPALRLLVAGCGPEEDQLRRRAERLDIDRSVSFVGSTGNVSTLLDSCAFTVLASTSEGMPNAVLESLAHGRAVVATAVGGTTEILKGGGGILVPPGDAGALADAIVALWSDPARRSDLGADGRRNVRESFAVDAMVEATTDLYVRLLARRGIRVRLPAQAGADAT
jgi:glycosyltransferase involved in cell wall biosynthesis